MSGVETPLTVRAPSGAAKGGVIVVQEAFGVTDHILDICDRLATHGWLAVAPHLFHRTGDPVLDYERFAPARAHLAKIDTTTIGDDVDAGLARLSDAGLGADSCGIVGFCMGGTVALAESTRRALGAAISFYGGGVHKGRFGYRSLVELAPSLQTPWLGLYGDRDRSIPTAQVDALETAAADASVPTEVVRYRDAGHGFNCDRRPDFHAASAADAWRRTLAWLDTYVATVSPG